MFWFLFLGCCATAQKWERVRCAVSNKQERTNNGQGSELGWKPKVWQLPPIVSGIQSWARLFSIFLSFAFNAMSYYSELTIASEFLGKNLDLSYNFDCAFMIDSKCKVLFCSIFHSGLILRFYGQGSKSRNFPKGTYISNMVHILPIGYMYFQWGTCISNRVHVFPKGYICFQ